MIEKIGGGLMVMMIGWFAAGLIMLVIWGLSVIATNFGALGIIIFGFLSMSTLCFVTGYNNYCK